MVWALTIILISIIGMIASVIFFPTIKIKKISFQTFWIFPTLGAILLLATQLVDFDFVCESLIANTNVNPLKILTLFISMVFLSIVLDEVGFFNYLALQVVKKAKHSQYIMFFFLYIIVSILTIFTSNDIIVITFTPFIIFFCKRAKISSVPFLILSFVASNTWSMLLIIGNPTNIYLASSFQIDFFTYVRYMFIPTIFASIVSFFIIFFIFRKKLKDPIEVDLDDESHIADKPICIVSLCILCICVILLAISSFINLEMWTITLGAAIIELIFLIIYLTVKKDKWFVLKESIKRLPINLIPLLLSMFIIILTLHEYDVTTYLFNVLGNGDSIITYGLSSFLIANLTNNIPMSILYADIIANFSSLAYRPIFASIISSNIAAYFTPIGALAGMMWMSILKKNDIHFSFIKFSGYGLIISLPTLLAALGGLYVSFLW